MPDVGLDKHEFKLYLTSRKLISNPMATSLLTFNSSGQGKKIETENNVTSLLLINFDLSLA